MFFDPMIWQLQTLCAIDQLFLWRRA